MHNPFTFAEEHAAACGEIQQMPEEPAEQVVGRNYFVEFGTSGVKRTLINQCRLQASRSSGVKKGLRSAAIRTAGIKWRPDSVLKKQPQAPARRAAETNDGSSFKVVKMIRV